MAPMQQKLALLALCGSSGVSGLVARTGVQDSPDKYLPIGQGAYVSGEAVAQRTQDLRKGCEDSKIYKSPNWQDCFTKGGDYIDHTDEKMAAPKVKAALLSKGSGPDKYLPIGQGAYVSGEAVAQRTQDLRKGCEDSKIYKSPNWQDCFTKGGDYIDHTDEKMAAPEVKASLAQESPDKYLPIGQGAYVSGEAVAQRTQDLRKGCEDSKIYKSPNWQDCFTKGGDYIDHTDEKMAAPKVKAALAQEAPEKYLPIGQGAYVSGEAVAQRTKDVRKGCEDSKIYKSANWQDCFTKGGDYIDATKVGK